MTPVSEMRRMHDEAVAYLKGKIDFTPQIGIILGTGLGSLVDGMEILASIDYDDIPHFPVSTVESHHGKLLLGNLRGKKVICMQGRFHFYEGYTFQQIVFPVRVMKTLGIETLIVSNACGGLNPNFSEGTIMLIKDHINFFPGNPLIGPNDDSFGVRFPDMFNAYHDEYRKIAHGVASELKIRIEEGVYLAVSGPNLETAAEYRMFRILGADAVGMSTVPEVLAARQQGTKVLAFSIVTDMGLADNMHPCSIESVLAVAAVAEPKLRDIIAGCVERL